MRVLCGNCHEHHDSVDEVRRCHAGQLRAPTQVDLFDQPVYNDDAPVASQAPTQTKQYQKVVDSVPFGTYTVVFGEDDYHTIEVTPWKNQPGKRVFAHIIGPDNSTDFQGFGHQGVDGSFKIWRSFRHYDDWIRAAQGLITLNTGGEEALKMATEMYALKSGRCARCHHKLTVPASIHRGLGEDCAEKWGVL